MFTTCIIALLRGVRGGVGRWSCGRGNTSLFLPLKGLLVDNTVMQYFFKRNVQVHISVLQPGGVFHECAGNCTKCVGVTVT